MKSALLVLVHAVLVCWCAPPAPGQTRSLFNGEDLAGWHSDVPAADANPDIEPSFTVRDGMLVSLGNPGGHLITDKIYKNYRLEAEYRFAGEPGNCGVLVHASTPRALYGMFPASIEVQMYHQNAGDFWCIAENIAVDDMASRRAGKPETWGGGPQDSRRILNMTDDSEKPVGQWNTMIIECLDDHVRVWVNGDLVNDGYDCTATEGHIAVQAEGSEVEFRRLDLTPIAALTPAGPWKGAGSSDQPPVRVFILAGQSNMEGKARVELLRRQIADTETADQFSHLHLSGQFLARTDAFIRFHERQGMLTVGYGSQDCIGPELEFGNVVAGHYEEPVLLIKTAWGGKSLARDFRPPSAGQPDDDALNAILERTNADNRKNNRPEVSIDDIRETYGHDYRAMLNEVRQTLDEMGERFPQLAGRETDIAGLVWFQGWNDQYDDYENQYEANLVHFIDDIRKDLGKPQLPVVIGVMGQNGSKPATGAMLTIQQAQIAVADRPEFAGTVRAVRTDDLVDTAAETLYPEWKERKEEWDKVGSDHPYHYYGSPIWYSRIGKAFGDAMLELIADDKSE